jgi:DNA topoisomerase-3
VGPPPSEGGAAGAEGGPVPAPGEPPAEAEPEADFDAEPEVAPRAERLPTEALAAAVAAAATGVTGHIATVERKRTRERPPLLYDLTSLQRRANQRYGFSADRTLSLAQALYEKHKLITYPRTDSRHLTPDEVPTLPGVLGALAAVPAYAPFAVPLRDGPPLRPGRRVVDAAEVGDHHAILPTDRSPLGASLSAEEKRIYDLVARRLLAVLLPDAQFDLAAVVVEVPPGAPLPAPVAAPLRFRARGRVCVDPGWQAADPPRSPQADRALSPVEEGMPATAAEAAVTAGQTRPPRPHSDASILKAMETAGRFLDDAELKRALRGAGLGTPATRASILETLVDRTFIERRGKELRATPLGASLIDAVPVEELKSAALTGRWEERLSRMSEGGDDRADFMEAVRGRVAELVAAILAAAPPPPEVARRDGPSLGPCPACGAPVRDAGKVYRCDTGRSCPFVVFKEMCGKKLGVRLVRALLKDGETPVIEGFESKAGKVFSAAIVLTPEKKAGFRFPERGAAPGGSPAGAAPGSAAPEGAAARGRGGRGAAAPAGGAAPARGAVSGASSGGAGPEGAGPEGAAPPARARGGGADAARAAGVRPGPAAASVARPGDACPDCGVGTIIAGRAGLGCGRWREGCGFRAPFPPGG